jgi:hypothetical protein
MKSVYTKKIKTNLNKMLSMIDRDPASISKGCGDRVYWGWKFTDFPGDRFQEAAYSLAWVYNKREFKRFYKNENILKWYVYVINYWIKNQNSDGSFDEAYPNEKSFAATSFTSFYISESYLLMQQNISSYECEKVEKALIKSLDWLCINDEHHGILTNHLSAASAALIIGHKITSKQKYYDRSFYFINKIIANQSSEGWYREYEGPDIGYYTHGLFYLVRVWQLTKNYTLLKSINRSIEYFKYFIHPNGSIGGEYSSRNTKFLFPAGIEMIKGNNGLANVISKYINLSISKNQSVSLDDVDNYNFYPLLNNYMFAYDNSNTHNVESKIKIPHEYTFNKYFIESGIYIYSNKNYYAICSLAKGGVIKIYSKINDLIFSNCGYWIKTESGFYSTHGYSKLIKYSINKKKVVINTPFKRINQQLMSPIKFILFRLYNLTLCKIPFFSKLLKKILVIALINKKKYYKSLNLHRIINFEFKKIIITDTIDNGPFEQSEFKFSDFTTIHMGSSKYFQNDELNKNLFVKNYQKRISKLKFQNRHIINI